MTTSTAPAVGLEGSLDLMDIGLAGESADDALQFSDFWELVEDSRRHSLRDHLAQIKHREDQARVRLGALKA